MATPIGHSIAGYVLARWSGSAEAQNAFTTMLLCIGMALAPDLDFIPGILVGQPALYHQGITHSLMVALALSGVIAAIFWIWRRVFWRVFLLGSFSYSSHLIIDFFGPDRRPPYGEPLFWPLSEGYFISPFRLFLGVHHAGTTSASTGDWIAGVLSLYNLGAIALEVLLLAPLAILIRNTQK